MEIQELNRVKARQSCINDCIHEINQEMEMMKVYSTNTEFDRKMISIGKEFCILKKQHMDKHKTFIDDALKILDSLSPKHKQILDMCYLKGIKSDVCAEILGVSLNIFASRKREAVKMFESR